MAARRIMLTWLAAGLMFAVMPTPAQPSQLEAAVKATYLYKLAPFVEWPQSARQGNFVICVVGDDPFGPVLDHAVAGQAYGSQPMTVARMARFDAQSLCHIVYAGGTPAQVAHTLRAVSGQPILTVTDGGKPSGMVDFAVQNGRVRFRIDQAEAEASGLTISSRLLSLALSVQTTKRRTQ